MQIKIDTTADALYIRLKRGKISKTKDRGDHFVDYDKKGNLLGFEILNFSKKVPMGGVEEVAFLSDSPHSGCGFVPSA
jgi:uncharacterized protein YuzE